LVVCQCVMAVGEAFEPKCGGIDGSEAAPRVSRLRTNLQW
jgi:hypothetical protein